MGSSTGPNRTPVAVSTLYGLLFIIVAGLSQRAKAEDPASAPTSAGPEVLQEVTVTAERRESGLQTTPIAITALSAGDLKSRSISGFSDIAQSVPGLSISGASTTAPSSALPVVYIRGIGRTRLFSRILEWESMSTACTWPARPVR